MKHNAIDIEVLARAVRADADIVPETGEKAAFVRLQRLGLVQSDSSVHPVLRTYAPTQEGIKAIDIMLKNLG